MLARTILLAALLQSGAPGPAPAPPRPAPAWQVDWGDYYCTLARLAGDDAPFVIGFRTIPGNFGASVRLLRHGRQALPRRISTIALLPSGQTFDVTAFTEVFAGGREILASDTLPDTFWDALAGAAEIEFRDGNAARLRLPLPGMAVAVRSLRRCVSDVMREWGVDEAALRALRRLPATTNLYGLRPEDYPTQANRAHVAGETVVRMTVSAEGRATECAVVATSGNAALDAATCRVILARARFTPALDADGRPTTIRIATAVIWRPG
jgi:TonB family protein